MIEVDHTLGEKEYRDELQKLKKDEIIVYLVETLCRRIDQRVQQGQEMTQMISD